MPHRTPIDRTQQIPFQDATDIHVRIARSLDLLNHWNAALTGQFQFDDVIAILVRQIDARNVSLFRFEGGRAHPISTRARAFDDHKPVASTGNLLRFICEHYPDKIQPGSLFQLSRLRAFDDYPQSAAKQEWDAKTWVKDASLVILAKEDDRIDALEFSFDTEVTHNPHIPPFLVTTAMANAWDNRTPGIISRTIQNNRRSRSGPLRSAAILGPENPAGLSRAEQRVCRLLADGETAGMIAERLGLSVSTVRSHLRSIYAKTETTGQINLISVIQQQRNEAEA